MPQGYLITTSAGQRLRSFLAGRAPVELAIEPPGVRLAGAVLPWRLIEHVAVTPAEVGIRLKPGAPLPDGVPAIVHDPRRQHDVHMRQWFGKGRVDVERLRAAVAATGVAVRHGVPAKPTLGARGVRRDAWAVVIDVRLRPGRVYLRSTFSEHRRAKQHDPTDVRIFSPVPKGRWVRTW
jgi:hypothetical protein